MNSIQRKLTWCMFVAYMSAPAVVHSTPWNYSDSPLWLGTSVQHNLMFAIDDSGSMDFEVLFANNDGAIYLNDNGFFADSSGALYESGDKYTYLFPNGYSGSYNGERKNNNHYAIPPVPAYAFARSPSFNSAYYDPSVTYNPWPNFDEYSSDPTKDTFLDADVDNTAFEPISDLNSVGTLALFADHDTASNTDDQWAFDIQDDAMVCDENGNTCSTGQRDDTYYPATYYLKDTEGSYWYHPDGDEVSTANTLVIEAESAFPSNLQGNMLETTALILGAVEPQKNDLASFANAAATSEGRFIGTLEAGGASSTGSAPPASVSSATYTFTTPSDSGDYKIWFRALGPDGSGDSLWVKLHGKTSADITPANGNNDWDATETDVNKMFAGISSDNTWGWAEWAEVNLTGNTSYTLEVRYREGGTLLDQIVVTSAAMAPSGILSQALIPAAATKEQFLCSSPNPLHYQLFARFPGRFSVDEAKTQSIDGLAYDGSCLTKYEIANGWVDDPDDGAPNGVSGELKNVEGRIERTTAEEKQNFANWFKYYRKRHQAMRGGLASAMQGVNGIQTGLFWINNRRSVEAGDMFDMDTTTGVKDFLSDHLEYVSGGGTPLRSALKHALTEYQSASGPIGSECQKNYTLLFTDGYNSEKSVDGIGNEDGSAGAPYQDSYDDTLGDIAYKGYSEQLRTDLPAGNVKVAGACGDGTAEAWEDCNTNLHMNTYTVGLGAKGTIFGVTHNDMEDAHTTPPTWPNVNNSRDARQIDDLYHAAVNGRGGMYSAATPDQLKTALGAALSDIIATIGSGSGVTFNASSLQSTEGTAIFTSIFNAADWTGDVGGLLLDPTSGAVGDPIWEDSNGDPTAAAYLLNSRDLEDKPRTILTWGKDADGNPEGAPFQWDSLQDHQKLDLKTNPDGSVRDATYPFVSGDPDYNSDDATNFDADADGKARLNFLRGDIQADMTLDTYVSGAKASYDLRDRLDPATGLPKRLADIVHSAPVYVGSPASIWPDDGYFGGAADDGSQRYSAFKTAKKDRTPAIYLGANGGMLHGFNASVSDSNGGQELLAYVPNAVYSSSAGEGLHYLTDPNYSHKYYVDLSPVAQDVYTTVDGSNDMAWRTMLVGGLRGGGRGLFALDVTDPVDFSEDPAKAANTVMWEFTSQNDGDMGYQLSPPMVAMMNNEKWAVIFGNGHSSDSGYAKLFILFVEEGLDGTWTLGSDYLKIDTGAGDSVNKNGLSGVTLADIDGDYVVDRIYGGDLYGNMWA
ncbi:pilus assembly protein, partial [Oleiphilus sp. HI0079]|uniref:pilus assembly protein n=3 Tax=unclassified Oleiphilus TaxID=2631174 RepID=UPI000AD87BA0